MTTAALQEQRFEKDILRVKLQEAEKAKKAAQQQKTVEQQKTANKTEPNVVQSKQTVTTPQVKPASSTAEPSIFIQNELKGGIALAPYVAKGSAYTLFGGAASIFGSMLLKDVVKNPTLQTVLKNMPVVGKAMALTGLVALISTFIIDNATSSLRTAKTTIKSPQ